MGTHVPRTLNQLLTELDGFDGESLVICLAATNRADMLDSALKRPGRFDRTVSVERPDKQGRKEILGVHIGARRLPLKPGFEVDDIATMTAGFSGAELENLVNEAALLAGRKGLSEVGEKEFEDAVLRTVAGIEKKRSLLTAAEKTVVSAHEAGHAVVGTAVGTLIPGCQRPEQLSIVARSGGALGFTYIPPGEEDRKLMFSDELRGRLVTLMGGRAAEIVSCSRVSTGALDDIQRATDLAYKAVAEYGLSASLGPMSVSTLSSGGNDDALFGGGVADGANRAVEKEVKDTLTSALWIAVGLVDENLRCLDEIGDELSETEKVSGDWLQKKLDEVVATPDLERFLRGHTPQPPEGSKVWENLPLPAFPRRRSAAPDARWRVKKKKKNGVRRRRERPNLTPESSRKTTRVLLVGGTRVICPSFPRGPRRHPRNSPRRIRERLDRRIVKLGQITFRQKSRFGSALEHVRLPFHTRETSRASHTRARA